MPTIAQGVEFDTIAREWRCKWSADNDKASLVEAQKAIDSILAEVKALDGCKSVQRVVCGGCLDFKVRSLLRYIVLLPYCKQMRFILLRHTHILCNVF
jgi:hypothetical protein